MAGSSENLRDLHYSLGSVAGEFRHARVEVIWPIPGGGSPDMGYVSAHGKQLRLSSRYDHEIYVIDTANGKVRQLPVKTETPGVTVRPQPGRSSIG